MTLKKLQEASEKRCEEVFHPVHSWSPTDWGCALAGEVGELCNMLKKLRRGDMVLIDETSKEAIAKEIADVQLYLPLLASRLGIDLEKATIAKFNEVSDKRNSTVKL